MDTGDRLLTPGEVAALFRVDPKTVTRWAAAGRIGSIRTPGGHRRFRESEVRALLEGEGVSSRVAPSDARPRGRVTGHGHVPADAGRRRTAAEPVASPVTAGRMRASSPGPAREQAYAARRAASSTLPATKSTSCARSPAPRPRRSRGWPAAPPRPRRAARQVLQVAAGHRRLPRHDDHRPALLEVDLGGPLQQILRQPDRDPGAARPCWPGTTTIPRAGYEPLLGPAARSPAGQ